MKTRRMAYLWLAVLVTAATILSSCVPAVRPDLKGMQGLPNMGQKISPLAPQGSTFEALNPGLADNPDWLAGQAATTVPPLHNHFQPETTFTSTMPSREKTKMGGRAGVALPFSQKR